MYLKTEYEKMAYALTGKLTTLGQEKMRNCFTDFISKILLHHKGGVHMKENDSEIP